MPEALISLKREAGIPWLDDQQAVLGQAVVVDGLESAAFHPVEDDFVMDDLAQKINLFPRLLEPELFNDFESPVDPAAEADIGRNVDLGRRGFIHRPFPGAF